MSKNKAHASTVVAAPKKTGSQVPANSEADARQGVALLVCQLLRSVPLSPECDAAERERLENAVIGLLHAVNPQDGLETMAAVQLAALNLASLDSLGRAANCPSDSRARDLNLRHGIKSSTAFTDLMKAIDGRRGQGRNNVSVGSVKLEPGAQAIIGNVKSGDKRSPETTDEQHLVDAGQDNAAIDTKPTESAA